MRIRIIMLCLFFVVTLVCKCEAAEQSRLYSAARLHANCGQWQQAIECYNKELSASPEDPVALARRGYAFASLGNHKQAFIDFTDAINSDTTCPDAYSRRSRVYAWLGLMQLAKQDAHKALELMPATPEEPDLLLEHAVLLNSVDKKQESLKEVKKVLASIGKDKDVSSLVMADRAHAALNQHKEAIYCLNQALKSAPDCFELYLLRGNSYTSLGKWTLAIADFNRFLTCNRKDPRGYLKRAEYYWHVGDYSKTIADCSHAISLAPNSACSFFQRGLAYNQLKEYQKAVRDFSSSISLEPADYYSYTERAQSYCYQKEWLKALKDTQQALLLNPKYERAHITQAWVHDRSSHTAAAMR